MRRDVGAAPSPGEFVGPWYSWWPGDMLPDFTPVPGFAAAPEPNDRTLVALSGGTPSELAAWRRDGNQPYGARIAGEIVACGWSASRTLAIGELDLVRPLAPGERYLWGFATADQWRGRGLYPRLLAAIVRNEGGGNRYWIGHKPGNVASGRGILKAGFGRVGDIYRQPTGEFALMPACTPERARIGAAILGASVWSTPVSPPT